MVPVIVTLTSVMKSPLISTLLKLRGGRLVVLGVGIVADPLPQPEAPKTSVEQRK
jgi:hypothetical protein